MVFMEADTVSRKVTHLDNVAHAAITRHVENYDMPGDGESLCY